MKYIIVGIVSFFIILFGVLLFTRGGNNSGTTATKRSVQLTEYATKPDTKVQFITDGPINGEEAHRAIRISVTADTRTLDIVQGYSGTLISTTPFSNTTDAYSDFLAALGRAGFNKENPGRGTDYQAICPTQFRYTFQLIENNTNVKKLWASSCATGSFAGNRTTVTQLFQAQIPGYGKLTSGVNFSLSQ